MSFARAKVAGAAAPLMEVSVAPGLMKPSSAAQLPGLMKSTSGHASIVSSASSQTPCAFFFFFPLKTMPALAACANEKRGEWRESWPQRQSRSVRGITAAPGRSVRKWSAGRLATRSSPDITLYKIAEQPQTDTYGGRILPRVDPTRSIQAANVSFKGKTGSATV